MKIRIKYLKSVMGFIKKNVKNIFGILLKSSCLPSILYYFGFNGRLAIEVTNSCNLRCRLCPTWQNMKRERGFMALEKFKIIIDDNQDILKRLDMIFAGEPLLNKDVFRMIKYAEDRSVRVLLSTNTTLFSDEKIEELFDSRLSYLVVCLDGATKETHEQYRRGSDFNQVVNNIEKICRFKKEKKLSRPYLVLQFLVMKQNENEIEKIIKLAKDLGVDKLSLKTLSLGSFVELDRKIELAKENLPLDDNYSRFTFKSGLLKEKSKPRLCAWLKQAVVLWNGDVSMCCYDFNGDLAVGNIFTGGGLKKILKSKKYRQRRKMAIQRKFKLCQNCNYSAETSKTVIFNRE